MKTVKTDIIQSYRERAYCDHGQELISTPGGSRRICGQHLEYPHVAADGCHEWSHVQYPRVVHREAQRD